MRLGEGHVSGVIDTMPVESYWYNEEKTIIIQTFSRSYTSEELYTDYQKMNMLLDDVSHQVDFIGDLQMVRTTPKELFLELPTVRKTAPPFTHPRARLLVYIMGNNFLAQLVKLFMTMFPEIAGNMYTAKSIEEAVDILIKEQKSRG